MHKKLFYHLYGKKKTGNEPSPRNLPHKICKGKKTKSKKKNQKKMKKKQGVPVETEDPNIKRELNKRNPNVCFKLKFGLYCLCIGSHILL